MKFQCRVPIKWLWHQLSHPLSGPALNPVLAPVTLWGRPHLPGPTPALALALSLRHGPRLVLTWSLACPGPRPVAESSQQTGHCGWVSNGHHPLHRAIPPAAA